MAMPSTSNSTLAIFASPGTSLAGTLLLGMPLLAKGSFRQGTAAGSPEKMRVHMENRLPRGLALVKDETELTAAVLVGKFFHRGYDLCEKRGVPGSQFRHVAVLLSLG